MGSLVLIATFSLYSGYRALYVRKYQGKKDLSASTLAEATFILFQGNFTFFTAFAVFSYAILPPFALTANATIGGLTWGYLHAGLSVILTSIVMLLIKVL